MSVTPGAMQALLAQKLMQGSQPQTYGGGAAGPQMQARANPLTAGANVAQTLMLMRALQGQPPVQQGQVLGTPSGANAMPAPAGGPQVA